MKMLVGEVDTAHPFHRTCLIGIWLLGKSSSPFPLESFSTYIKVNTIIYCACLGGCGCIVCLMKLIWSVYCEAHTSATCLRILTGDGVATVRKTEHMHYSSPTDVAVGVVHLLKIPCAAAVAAIPHHWLWIYCLWGLSLVVQKCKNYMAVSVVCMQSVWAPAISWHSFGPQHWTTCGRHRSAAGWCSQCVWSWYMAVTALDVTVCIICIVTWFKVQKQGCHCQQRQYHFPGRCLWLTALHLGCSGVSALCTSLISCRH